MGHTAFVSSAAFFDCARGLRLLSGSGDGTVRYKSPLAWGMSMPGLCHVQPLPATCTQCL